LDEQKMRSVNFALHHITNRSLSKLCSVLGAPHCWSRASHTQ